MTAPFRCPRCTDTYQPHWAAPDASGLCHPCANFRDGRCALPGHPDHDSPCTYGTEAPGDPCRYCAAPVPDDGPCLTCWLRFASLPMADVRAVFAADGFDTVPRPGP
ncbi:hypothetical protein VSR01_16510 [Actinacidiphila sp. DG2A-62]|uniref:hypothetical protein n=1 Tax=Actinacidiphila sp. DG2A-62 TaxID=3108821 RepID=UPI002DBD230A|nr:hypothetical protein [Actinacidiphila sp. DG2A-62]MEC3995049.1 hypothetical protein [Actinacidiphila sp. DG2A-62]